MMPLLARRFVLQLALTLKTFEETHIYVLTPFSTCPDFFNPVSQGLATWWSDMAMCLYPAFIGSGDACERLGLCKKRSLLGEWTCDDCTAVMTRVADFMKEPTTIEEGVGILTGECFCGAEGHTDECPGLVNSLAEPCMQVLSAVLMETTPELCQDIVGVC